MKEFKDKLGTNCEPMDNGLMEHIVNKYWYKFSYGIFTDEQLEMFFEDFNPIDRINYDIGGTGWVGANFRGLIDGKDDSLPVDYDYKILMLEEYKCPTKVELKNIKRSSKFRPNFTLADS